MEADVPKTSSQTIHEAKAAFALALEDPEACHKIRRAVEKTRARIESDRKRLEEDLK